MSRWPLLTVFSMVWPLAGCASSVRPGLANVPRADDGLGSFHDRIYDVVANGEDSCGKHAEQGPLRGRWPPCRSMAHPAVSTLLLPANRGAGESLVVPWLEHFYVGWPCDRGLALADSKVLATATTAPQEPSCEAP